MIINLEDYIKKYTVSLPDNFLESLINTYEKHMCIAKIGMQDIDIKYRNCISSSITERYHISTLYNEIDKCLKIYYEENNFISISQTCSGYNFLKYEPGCYYKQHIDQSSGNANRVLSLIINLNEDYVGGEIGFFNNTYKIPLKKNEVIIFPSNFLFPHEVNTITSGYRYSIVSWFY